MMWRKIFFRILGIVCFGGGLFAFYYFGKEIVPLFTQFVAGVFDFFAMFTVLSSFFIGALALLWIGTRLVALRSFSNAWLYYAILPITVWLQRLYDVGLVGTLDRVLSLSVIYLLVYMVVLSIVLFVHKHWFTPLSHESMRHVSLEKADSSLIFELRWIILGITLITLLILHPAPIGETIDMIVSTVSSIVMWFVG